MSTWILAVVRRIGRRIILRLAEKKDLYGIQVLDLVVNGAEGEAFDDVTAAMALIDQYHPAVLRRMIRDVRCLALAKTVGTAGEYWEDIRSILLNVDNVRRQTAEAVAMVIVHEAMHARLWRMGVGKFPDRERIERICVQAEIAFAKRIPSTQHLVRGAEMKFASKYWEPSPNRFGTD